MASGRIVAGRRRPRAKFVERGLPAVEREGFLRLGQGRAVGGGEPAELDSGVADINRKDRGGHVCRYRLV